MTQNDFMNARATKMRDEIIKRGLSLIKIGRVYHITGNGLDIRTTDLSTVQIGDLDPWHGRR